MRERDFDSRRLVEDFVLHDRRLGERRDFRIWIDSASDGRTEVAWDQRGVAVSLRVGGTWIQIQADELSESDIRALRILPTFLTYLAEGSAADPPWYLDQASGQWTRQGDRQTEYQLFVRRLAELRKRRGFSQADLADHIGTGRIAFSRWEAAAQKPGRSAIYRWCAELGIFCPPKTALVTVVDVSPELLSALKTDPNELNRLSPDQFESFIANRLDGMGYRVTLAGATNRKDGGIDIIAVPKLPNVGSIVLAVQVKHHTLGQKTGRDAVDRLAAWQGGPFGAGLLVTNTGFTKDAVWAAARERNAAFLRLRDFQDLKRWIRDQYGDPDDWREIPEEFPLAPGFTIRIPKVVIY